MENMLHLAPSLARVPDCFIIPPDQLPPATTGVVSLPVIDMSGSHDEVCRAILDAGKEYGFFQVVNHGVPEQVMQDMEAVCAEFYRLPAADKAHLYSEDKTKPNRLFSGTTYNTGGDKYWMDCLRLACPVTVGDAGDATSDGWPDKPRRLREVFERFVAQSRGVGMRVLRLLCDAAGLRADYFDGKLSRGDAILGVNHYPPCPDPAATLGLPPHCDRNLITLLVTGPVHGLEVLHAGEWVKVQHVPGAFVVNFGLQLEVVTNGMLKSVEHRVMTNAALPRTAVALFICPTEDCVVGPAEELVGDGGTPCYRALRFDEFKRIYATVKLGSALNLTTNLKNNQKADSM
ncbi:hypothetical protein U9M48_030512 [Paspalum notatum var. saurae]|uniref:Fe2OG dioxygenase domain-containing protein n=1 Tax=Paspalum notatum var. saurae TaxID=547442 RepID=A0AAQ3U0I2_PASNO